MNNEKIGIWKYIFAEKVIGGGKYQNGKKNGSWTELSDNFFSFNQVTICGEYRLDKKVGKWDIYSRKDRFTQFSKLGGGEYNNDGFKNGNWIELSEDFCEDIFFKNEVIYDGNYVNDKKKGVWKELKRGNLNDGFQKVKEIHYLDFLKKNQK